MFTQKKIIRVIMKCIKTDVLGCRNLKIENVLEILPTVAMRLERLKKIIPLLMGVIIVLVNAILLNR